MKQEFLKEYTSEVQVKRYFKKTAGDGIEYLLRNVYGPIYIKYIENNILGGKADKGLRRLEFGCGGGVVQIPIISPQKSLLTYSTILNYLIYIILY